MHGQLSWAADTLVALRTGAKTPPCIVVYDTSDSPDLGDDPSVDPSEHRPWPRHDLVVGSSAIGKDHPSLVEPQLVTVQSDDGVQLFGRLYVSATSQGRLLCWIHGGPTDQWTVSFLPRFVYWLDRGYDILVPDHRGSTGHGRAYTQALRGQWGDVDVKDVHSLVQRVVQERNQTPLALMGSSAGGMTALAFLARYPNLAAAAVVAYPVSDMAALDDVTHRFEAHYNRTLLGSPAETQRLSSLRSPRHHVAAIASTPLLIFHGTDDPVVPIAQSEELVAGLRSCGADVEYVVFEGEGHGFRDVDHKIYEYVRTEDFLRRHLAE
jgi:dipeptidyl aminopeptidase/acylaminoacyl peptidase